MEIIKKHRYSSDDKLKHLGYGEWVEEPDEIYFTHKGLKCRLKRILRLDDNGGSFGGHWCGYVQLPENHPWIKLDGLEINSNVHGGITYSRQEEDGYWVGFDCAHSNDISPSTERFFNTNSNLVGLKEKFPNSFVWERSYKNAEYVEAECRGLADQALQELSLKKN